MDTYPMDYEKDTICDAAEILNGLAEQGECEAAFGAFAERLSDASIGQLLLQLPFTEVVGDPESRSARYLAVEVADALGPDHAQALYHFAVLVTKLV